MGKQEVALKVDHVGMKFNLSKEKVDNLKEYFIKFVKKELTYQEFWALKDVTFNVKKGEHLGIVGLNGAGKSTLLKVIAGSQQKEVSSPRERLYHYWNWELVLISSIQARKIYIYMVLFWDTQRNLLPRNIEKS
jgi:ABC-type cobalamin/Fe3+-siderophores transport system ATPase subunit